MAEETEEPKKSQLPKIIGAVVMLAAAGAILYLQFKPGGVGVGASDYFYWDEKAGALIVRGHELAPFKVNPNDAEATGVRAWVYTCGSCADESARFVAYVEKFSPAARQRLADANVSGYEALDDDVMRAMVQPADVLVRRTAETQWVEKGDDFMEAITKELEGKCGGAGVKLCPGPNQ